MHDMSNTRKEIAARLGFAAGNGAKESFASPDDISNMAQLLSRVESAVMNKRMDEARKLLKQIAPIVDRNRGDNELDSQGMVRAFNDYKQKLGMSRPGAKASFDNKQIAQGLSRLLKETGFDGMASDVLSGSSDSETLRKYVRVLKGKMSPLSGDAKSAELLSKLEKMLSSRSGEKVEMEKPIYELKKAMNKAVLRWSSISSSNHKAQIKARQPDATPSDIQQAAALKRQSETAWREFTEAQIAYKTAAGLPMQSSRPGTKTRMTRDQTEEQKAGLKIMSAADPAVGAKIATLIKEGKPQDQAVAIALDMKRRGEL